MKFNMLTPAFRSSVCSGSDEVSLASCSSRLTCRMRMQQKPCRSNSSRKRIGKAKTHFKMLQTQRNKVKPQTRGSTQRRIRTELYLRDT